MHTALIWSQHGHSGGEPIFVPNPDGTKEDDGILLSVVLNGHTGKSYLAVLDARVPNGNWTSLDGMASWVWVPWSSLCGQGCEASVKR